jgi:hypothetical protein
MEKSVRVGFGRSCFLLKGLVWLDGGRSGNGEVPFMCRSAPDTHAKRFYATDDGEMRIVAKVLDRKILKLIGWSEGLKSTQSFRDSFRGVVQRVGLKHVGGAAVSIRVSLVGGRTVADEVIFPVGDISIGAVDWIRLGHRKKQRSLLKYAVSGRFKDGVYFCRSGKIIDAGRVHKYERMCHSMVRQFLPALVLHEATYDYDDLINQCRREVFLALLDGFDPVKAMTSNIADPVAREKKLAEKKADPARALVLAEQTIVYGRLKNFLRRIRHRYHPEVRGGKTVCIPFGQDQDSMVYKNGAYERTESFLTQQESCDAWSKMLSVAEKSDFGEIRKSFMNLSEPERESVVEGLISLEKQSAIAFENHSVIAAKDESI